MKKRQSNPTRHGILLCATLLGMVISPARGDTNTAAAVIALRQELRTVREQLAALEKRMDRVESERSDVTGFTTITVPIHPRPTLGSTNAPLVLTEFASPECVYSRAFHDYVLPELKRKHIDTGKLQFIARAGGEGRITGGRDMPTYILGKRAGDILTGERFVGVLPAGFFDARIRALLKENEPPRSRFGIETIGVKFEGKR